MDGLNVDVLLYVMKTVNILLQTVSSGSDTGSAAKLCCLLYSDKMDSLFYWFYFNA